MWRGHNGIQGRAGLASARKKTHRELARPRWVLSSTDLVVAGFALADEPDVIFKQPAQTASQFLVSLIQLWLPCGNFGWGDKNPLERR
jgi:hypothetical protein